MNNRYIYRGKRKYNGEWVEGFYYKDLWSDNVHYIIYDGTDYEVIPETIGQYTGLKDKNGRRIFENDMLTMPAYRGSRTKSVVYFKNGKFAVDGSNYAFKDIYPRNMEVIGNIFDNPELLP